MKILVVEDTQPKLKKIILALLEIGVPRDDIDTVDCSYSARSHLRSDAYDLLLLDILIPFRQEDDPDSQVCIELIDDICAGGDYIQPRQIIGLTAYDEAMVDAFDAFDGCLWNVIKIDNSDSGWVERIKNCVNYLRSASTAPTPRKSEADVLIVCALRSPELDAVKRLKWSWEVEAPFDEVSFISRATFKSGEREVRVVAAAAPRMGMVASGILASKLIAALQPELCIMPGICAGFSGRIALGDVIFADPVWDYQAGKRSIDQAGASRFEMAPHQLHSAPELRAIAEQLSEDRNVLRSIKDGWPSPPAHELALKIGPVASGSAVVADANFAQLVSQQQRAALGLEMELYGVSSACAMAGSPRPLFAGVKSVCDLADEKKNDNFQAYASYTSAKVIEELIRRYYEAR
ncbi:UNVERIFIED_ORG: nucleoside phosphorylase [Xanthomonas campestris]|uniref:5'-methylthioadenosine/S-adenosylhomocysteine nucleosidase family protein n=1 Tax=Xanthomonas arboricola TaxID=56448 RepID=UPI001613E7B3